MKTKAKRRQEWLGQLMLAWIDMHQELVRGPKLERPRSVRTTTGRRNLNTCQIC